MAGYTGHIHGGIQHRIKMYLILKYRLVILYISILYKHILFECRVNKIKLGKHSFSCRKKSNLLLYYYLGYMFILYPFGFYGDAVGITVYAINHVL